MDSVVLLLLYHSVPPHTHHWQLTFATVEVCFIGYFTFKTIRDVLFMVHLIRVSSLANSEHIRELNAKIGELVLRLAAERAALELDQPNSEPSNNEPNNEPNDNRITFLSNANTTSILFIPISGPAEMAALYDELDEYYRQCKRLMAIAEASNREVVSGVMMAALLTNIGINLLIVSKQLLAFNQNGLDPGPLQHFETAVLLTFVALQTGITVVACAGMTAWSNSFGMTMAGRHLYPLQLMLVGRRSPAQEQLPPTVAMRLLAKLRLLSFYEQVCRRDRFRFTVGSLSKISRKTVGAAFFSYLSLLIFVVKLVQNGKL